MSECFTSGNTYNGVQFGYLYGCGMVHLTEVLTEISWAFDWALITCVDGGGGEWLQRTFLKTDPRETLNVPIELFSDFGLLLKASDSILLMEEDYWLSDFSEVWLFRIKPSETLEKPPKFTSEGAITAPRARERRRDVSQWIVNSECVLGLGDGVGVNFASGNEAVIEALSTMSGFMN